MLTITKNRVREPRPDEVVFYQPRNYDNQNHKKPYPVIVSSVKFEIGGRVSNFFYWQSITPTGRIRDKVEHGYGNFYAAEGWSVSRKITITK